MASEAGVSNAPQVVLEGSLVNLDVTSPGATLALALMYLRTGDARAAAAFELPSTHYGLDLVKPLLIQLRVLARALVMWDAVAPTRAWVAAQLPDLIKVFCFSPNPPVRPGCSHTTSTSDQGR